MIIRRARKSDLLELGRMVRRTVRICNSRVHSSGEILAILKGNSKKAIARKISEWPIFLVAIEEGLIVGTVSVTRDGWMRRLYVTKSFQGRGLGRKLVLEAEALLRKKGFSKMRLNSSLNAKGFYERLGYRPLGRGLVGKGNGKIRVFRFEKVLD